MHEKALDYGIELSGEQLNLFDIYLNELIEWNSRMNLTGLKEQGRMIVELFLDSLIPVPYLPEKGRMLDVGSGAGFPAIVINVMLSNLKSHLVEANSKKASFLKQIIRLLKLDNIKVINGRLEMSGDMLHPDGYDVISARALAGLDQIINWCSPLLSSSGMLVYFSGSSPERDLKDCEHLIKEHNLTIARSIPYSLPGMRDSRTLVILAKEMQ